MPFPTPSEFALKATNSIGSGDWLAFPQPTTYIMEWAPLRENGDGGWTRQGLNNVVLVYHKTLHQDMYKVLEQHWKAAVNLPYWCRYWDEEAGSPAGSGAYTTVKCILEPPTFDRIRGQRYFGVRMRWLRLGIT